MAYYSRKSNAPPLVAFLVIFAITLSLVIVMVSMLDRILNPDSCEDVDLNVENVCYSSISQEVRFSVKNEGVYISRLEAVVDDTAVIVDNSNIRSGGSKSVVVRLSNNPGSFDLLPVLRSGEACYNETRVVRNIGAC